MDSSLSIIDALVTEAKRVDSQIKIHKTREKKIMPLGKKELKKKKKHSLQIQKCCNVIDR